MPSSFLGNRFAWLIACCALAWAGACASAGMQHHWFSAQPWIWQTTHGWRLWTLWTAPLIGLTPFHTFGNVLALAAVGVLGHTTGARPREALALLIAWPLSMLGLLLWPAVGWYAGLSGVIHAAAAIVVWRALTQRSARRIGMLLAAGLLIKLLLERGWAVPVAFDSNWGFNVVYAAHLSGAFIGFMTAAAVDGGTSVFSYWQRTH
ncbi:MAG: rhomboid family intramembrane serine protease [Burkholderiaceae bacterium]|nr:rhomboid family intramembrane serine protease [Burkholderiaceae bacterium]